MIVLSAPAILAFAPGLRGSLILSMVGIRDVYHRANPSAKQHGLRPTRNFPMEWRGCAPSRGPPKRVSVRSPRYHRQIRSLEEEVGARLLDRSGGKVSLTASGKLFLKYAEGAVEARKGCLHGDRRNRAHPARRNCGGRERRYVSPRAARGFCRIQEELSRRGGWDQAGRLRQRRSTP